MAVIDVAKGSLCVHEAVTDARRCPVVSARLHGTRGGRPKRQKRSLKLNVH